MTKHAIGWHPADVKAAVAKRGATLRQVAQDAGLSDTAVMQALRTPCYAGEQALAAFLGVPAHEIWPGRYDSAGLPKHPRIRKQLNARNNNAESQKRDAA